jgi:Arc/MetJ-type ribon-helix-helix transcriptional regulator
MKTITIHVPEEQYQAFKEYAVEHDKSAAELIRAAMDEYYKRHMEQGHSVLDIEPLRLGKSRRDLSPDDDLLEEMLHDRS